MLGKGECYEKDTQSGSKCDHWSLYFGLHGSQQAKNACCRNREKTKTPKGQVSFRVANSTKEGHPVFFIALKILRFNE